MPVGPNLAETPRSSKIRKYTEIFIYVLFLFIIYPISLNNDEVIFQKYLRDFNKTYENKTVYEQRFAAFKESLRYINELNANRSEGSATYGLTKYSDLFPKEFSTSQLALKPNSNNYKLAITRYKRSSSKFTFSGPQKLDLREKHVVSEVQAQGSCGACWAFSVIGIVESMNAINTGNFTRLSIQQMIDCSIFDYGCTGGNVCSLLDWLTTFDIKILEENQYPLTLKTEVCKDTSSSSGVHVTNFVCDSFVNREYKMIYLLSKSIPLAVAINAQSWQHYIGGTIQYHCDSNSSLLNHAVQIVGYDLTAPVPHYIVKNSWGKDFGDEGYLYIGIGDNLCGLAHDVASVNVL